MWVFFALLTSLADASYYLCNQTIKLSPQLFILLRGYYPALFLLPFTLFFQAPSEPLFYYVCVVQGALIAYHDFACFKAIKQFGAEIVSSVLPLSTGMLFVFWLLIEPSTVTRYLADKPQFILISSSIGGIIYSVCKYNHQPESSAALRYMWLMLFVAMMINMLNKIAAMHGGTSPMVISIYYAFVSSLTVGVINTFLLIKNVKGKPHIDISLIFKPKILGLYILLLLSMIFKNVAMNYSPDPTYVAALIYLSILWIILGNYVLDRLRLISSYSHAKWRYVALLVFSSIILILVTGTHNS